MERGLVDRPSQSWLALVPIHLPHPPRLFLQALVNPDVPCWGSPPRLSDDDLEFLTSPDHPISHFRHNDNLVLGETIYAVGVPPSPVRHSRDVQASAVDGSGEEAVSCHF